MDAIVAVDARWGIGRDGGLLFRISADLRRFKALTMGHTVVMGRRTLQSLPGGRGLPGRRNLVLSQAGEPCPGGGGGVPRGAADAGRRRGGCLCHGRSAGVSPAAARLAGGCT